MASFDEYGSRPLGNRSFVDPSALEAASLAAQRYGDQRAMQAPQFIEPDIVQPPQQDERSIKLDTIAEFLSAIGSIGRGREPSTPVGTARANQRAGQADVAKQRQQIANAKAEFDMRLATQAYQHNVERRDRLADNEAERQANLKNLNEQLDKRLANEVKMRGMDPVVADIAKSLGTHAATGATITDEIIRQYAGAMKKTDGTPADGPKEMAFYRNEIAMRRTARETQFKDKLTEIGKRNEGRNKAEADRIAAARTAIGGFDKSLRSVESEIGKIDANTRSELARNSIWTKMLVEAGGDPAAETDEFTMSQAEKILAAVTPGDQGALARYGAKTYAEVVALRKEIEKFKAQRKPLEEKAQAYRDKIDALSTSLTQPVAPAADPMVDPDTDMTPEQMAEMLRLLMPGAPPPGL